MADSHANFALSSVLTAPVPAASGTSLTVSSGGGLLFPTPPFNAVVYPVNTVATLANSEIVRVTNIVGDVFTITRTQEGTSARTIIAGDQIANTVTAKTLTDVENQVTGGNYSGGEPGFTPASGYAIATDTSNGREWKYWGGAWH